MKKVLSYLGHLRIYSLSDLWFLLAVAGATGRPLWGALLLHVGFLAFLEYYHEHRQREPVPGVLPWLILFLCGLIMYGRPEVGGWYIILSILYSMKKQGYWGLISPFARGAQTFVLLFPFLTSHTCLVWTAAAAMIARNLLGDLRDVEQDRREGLHTWPVVLGLRRDLVFVHLFGVIGTTWLWWWFSSVLWLVPLGINLIEIITYWLTPRPSNKNTALWLHGKILRRFRR